MRVNNNIQKLRTKAELTQEELAESVGVTRQTVIALEKGDYTPSVLLALKISNFFKKPVDKVFSIKK